MANQRGIRRGKIPFRARRRRRPTRWIDCASASILNLGPPEPGEPDTFVPGQLSNLTVGLMGESGTQGAAQSAAELIVGDGDTWWADDNEVRVERIVGNLTFEASARATYLDLIGNANLRFKQMLVPVVRFGLLVVAEEDEEVVALPPSLHEHDDLEETQWLYLYQGTGGTGIQWTYEETEIWVVRHCIWDVPIDIRVKRKLSRRDRLVMVYEHGFLAGIPSTSISAHVSLIHQLRCLVSTSS